MEKSTHKVEIVPVVLQKHPNADTLSIVSIFDGGYQVVVRTDDWVGKTIGAYIPPDSICPNTDEYAYLLGHLRIKARRFRGAWSMGLLVDAPKGSKIGDNVADILGIKHYEPPMKANLGGNALPNKKNQWKMALRLLLKGRFRVAWMVFKQALRRDFVSNPGTPAPQYDVDNLRRYLEVFRDGEPVVVSEKVHGCLMSGSSISLSDGKRKKISKIKVGDFVLGMDGNGKIVSSVVINVFENGSTSSWLKVTSGRRGIGKGNHYAATYCTPEHLFYVPDKKEYVKACDLNKDDGVLGLRSDLGMTPIQKQVILGKLLGDGYLYIHEFSAALFFGHCEKDKEYVDWTLRGLGSLSGGVKRTLVSGYGSNIITASSIGSVFIKEIFSDFKRDGKKHIPEWVVHEIGPIALAFWYMDDGSLFHHEDQEDRAAFAVCGFDEKDCLILQRCFLKFGIKSVLFKSDDKYFRIRLNADEAEKLFILVAPYIPICMQRKLPERYRGHSGWLPDILSSYKSAAIKQKVINVVVVTKSKVRYDIETETHNYFAGGVLVHNCNSRFLYHRRKMFCGSHRRWVRNPKTECFHDKIESKNVYWKILDVVPGIEKFCRENPNAVVYGEIYNVQKGFNYGLGDNEIGFVAFDIYDVKYGDRPFIGSRYLPIDVFRDVCKRYDIPTVPYLYTDFKYNFEKLEDISNNLDSKIPGAKHLAEGIVVKPRNERSHVLCGRVQMKLVSNRYLKESKDE